MHFILTDAFFLFSQVYHVEAGCPLKEDLLAEFG
jgi:hypothetical protein